MSAMIDLLRNTGFIEAGLIRYELCANDGKVC